MQLLFGAADFYFCAQASSLCVADRWPARRKHLGIRNYGGIGAQGAFIPFNEWQ
jgi:hypothetical protein